MNRKDMNFIKEWLSVLIKQPLQHISRCGGTIIISFGDFIEKESWNRNEDGEKVNIRKILVGKYQLHIECTSRFICGDKVVLGKTDLYEPTSDQEKQEDFDWDSFDWDIKGGNRYDELAGRYFSEDSPKFFVEEVKINRIGDLKIKLTNGFVLEVIIDTSVDECWRFFEIKAKDHLIITGQGIKRYDESDSER